MFAAPMALLAADLAVFLAAVCPALTNASSTIPELAPALAYKFAYFAAEFSSAEGNTDLYSLIYFTAFLPRDSNGLATFCIPEDIACGTNAFVTGSAVCVKYPV